MIPGIITDAGAAIRAEAREWDTWEAEPGEPGVWLPIDLALLSFARWLVLGNRINNVCEDSGDDVPDQVMEAIRLPDGGID